jgi:hypothetical protein
MSEEVPPAELQRRHTLADRFHNSQKLVECETHARGLRLAINDLLKMERELLAEIEKLKPARQTEGHGGA